MKEKGGFTILIVPNFLGSDCYILDTYKHAISASLFFLYIHVGEKKPMLMFCDFLQVS